MEWPKLKRDWTGLRVRSLRVLRNGYHEIPAGKVFIVKGYHRGLQLDLDAEEACPTCGIRAIYITKVPVRDVELLCKETKEPKPAADKSYEPDFAKGPIEG
jgi:hypothetical protein